MTARPSAAPQGEWRGGGWGAGLCIYKSLNDALPTPTHRDLARIAVLSRAQLEEFRGCSSRGTPSSILVHR